MSIYICIIFRINYFLPVPDKHHILWCCDDRAKYRCSNFMAKLLLRPPRISRRNLKPR